MRECRIVFFRDWHIIGRRCRFTESEPTTEILTEILPFGDTVDPVSVPFWLDGSMVLLVPLFLAAGWLKRRLK